MKLEVLPPDITVRAHGMDFVFKSAPQDIVYSMDLIRGAGAAQQMPKIDRNKCLEYIFGQLDSFSGTIEMDGYKDPLKPADLRAECLKLRDYFISPIVDGWAIKVYLANSKESGAEEKNVIAPPSGSSAPDSTSPASTAETAQDS